MRTIIINLLIFSSIVFSQSESHSAKYQKWLSGSHFRGYNILYESPKTLQDFQDFKNYGGNYFLIGIDGFMAEDAPYNIVQSNIDGTDMLVNFCRATNIYYSIAVRSGPGAYDTYDESQGYTGESRIWEASNTTEKTLYANMLKMIVDRYATDSLFVGIILVVEPRPKVRYIPANTSALYKWFLENVYNIHMDQVYQYFINEIRSVDANIPIIVENFAYSTPELFPSYVLDDPYLIYSAHNYQPKEFTNAQEPFTRTYPGVYWNLTYLAQRLYDSAFIRNTIFSKVKEFQNSVNAPVLLGEFGMFLPQNGGEQYIDDVLSMCNEYGWHFALWDWRRGSGQNWNIEQFTGDNHQHWINVLKNFHAPPVPVLRYPEDSTTITNFPVRFRWDSLTAFTKYDVYIIDEEWRKIATELNVNNSFWDFSGQQLISGKTYGWIVRSKNPGGSSKNWSEWSEPRYFYVPQNNNPNQTYKPLSYEYSLSQNYPNPFNSSTIIQYSVAENSNVNFTLYDITGREVKKFMNENLSAGKYSLILELNNYPAGIYIYRINIKSTESNKTYSDSKKLILLK